MQYFSSGTYFSTASYKEKGNVILKVAVCIHESFFDGLDCQRDFTYNKNRMKALSMQFCRIFRIVVPVLMLMLLLAGITVSAFHNHHDCENPDTCAICSFQISHCTLSLDTVPGSGPSLEPVLFSFIPFPERVTHPFHTLVFASHAPPQFC